ncbi:DUF4212 domain-containing protein [Janthinobacterium sp. Mn2066]|uniref:DUF4212 domain-containing protein n=1 Tax=Janthinobacterium sp. Mn2066 TaxID=3395264 RepID=UPI003BE9B9B8
MDKPTDHAALQARRAAHWRKTQRLTLILLVIWLLTGFLTVFYARELLHLNLFGWPLPFYMAAQGASLVYLAIIGAYAWSMRRLDREFHRAQQAAEEQP